MCVDLTKCNYLQLLDLDYGTIFHRTRKRQICRTIDSSGGSAAAVAKDIFVWIVGPRRNVNYFNCAV